MNLKHGLVGTSSLDRVHEGTDVDVDRVAEEFAADVMVAGYQARHAVLVGDGLAHTDLDFAAFPEPAASGGVIDLDLKRFHSRETTVLEDPRELLACGSN